MIYKIEYNERISLQKIPTNIRNSIKRAIGERLGCDPVKFGKPLRGSLKGYYRLRVGDYRIIYKVKELEVVVVIIKIGNRSNVYDI